MIAAARAIWARAWMRRVVRPLGVPRGLHVVCVGGATLGGSGKTPLAIACAAELVARGARVALVGHAYRARPGRARVVRASDDVCEVGDEALVACAALGDAPVVVAPNRAEAVRLAAQMADVVVIDGVAQIAPVRAALALLAVDADEPWPQRSLRAPIESMRSACDEVVAVRGESSGAWLGERRLGWDQLRALRVGLLCALARPERVVASLARRGVHPVAIACARDHGPFSGAPLRRARAAAPDLWLASPKCALHAPARLRAPLAILDYRFSISATPLAARLGALTTRSPRQ